MPILRGGVPLRGFSLARVVKILFPICLHSLKKWTFPLRFISSCSLCMMCPKDWNSTSRTLFALGSSVWLRHLSVLNAVHGIPSIVRQPYILKMLTSVYRNGFLVHVASLVPDSHPPDAPSRWWFFCEHHCVVSVPNIHDVSMHIFFFIYTTLKNYTINIQTYLTSLLTANDKPISDFIFFHRCSFLSSEWKSNSS